MIHASKYRWMVVAWWLLALPGAALALPPVTGYDLKGDSFDLRAQTATVQSGKAVLLVFYANNCHACLDEVPVMKQVRTEVNQRPVEIVYVNVGDDEAAISRVAKRYQIDFRIILDPKQSIYTNVLTQIVRPGVTKGLPLVVLVAPGGEVPFAKTGMASHDELLHAITQTLAGR